jgi:hypothetical protein
MSNWPEDVEINQIQIDLAKQVTPYCLNHKNEVQDKTNGFCSLCNEKLYVCNFLLIFSTIARNAQQKS